MQNTQISSNLLVQPALAETRPCIVRAADVPFMQGPGESGAFLLTGAETGGYVTVSSAIVDVNGGPPPHVHANEEEIFVVQSGAFELLANGELVTARAGDVAYMARGEAHRFRGLDTGEPNHFHIIIAPSGFEQFMRRWVPLFENGAPDMQKAVELCGEYGIALYPSDDTAPPVPANPATKIIGFGQKPELSVMGARVTVLLDSQDTGGQYGLIRVEGPANFGPPVHIHEYEDEMFIVEKGQVELTLGDEVVVAQEGDVAWAPRGYPHTFRLLSAESRILAFITPGGVEEFFVECDRLGASGELTPAAMVEVSARFGMTYPGL